MGYPAPSPSCRRFFNILWENALDLFQASFILYADMKKSREGGEEKESTQLVHVYQLIKKRKEICKGQQDKQPALMLVKYLFGSEEDTESWK